MPEIADNMFDDELYKGRYVTERTNAWIDSFKALLIRFEFLVQNWISLHLMAFSVILLRKVAKKNKSLNSFIVKFDNFQSSFVFKNEDNKKFPNVSTNNEISHAECIGPGVYNDKDNCIYFYSQNGIFKGILSQNDGIGIYDGKTLIKTR